MRQPKYFYKKSTPKETIPVTNETPTLDEVVVLTKHQISLPEIKISPKLLLGIGVVSLTSIGIVGFLPGFLAQRKQMSLLPNVADTNQTILQEKGSASGLHFEARTSDGRVDIVANFLSRYKSPLQPYDKYAQVLVSAADRYGLDYRLLPAIMMQESNLCKTADPAIHNCLGFGIHKRGTLAFDSYEASFDRAAREIKENYIDIGLTTPEQIMTKYTPSSNGSWANSVNQWIAEMEYNSRDRGLTSTQNADLTVYSQVKK